MASNGEKMSLVPQLSVNIERFSIECRKTNTKVLFYDTQLKTALNQLGVAIEIA